MESGPRGDGQSSLVCAVWIARLFSSNRSRGHEIVDLLRLLGALWDVSLVNDDLGDGDLSGMPDSRWRMLTVPDVKGGGFVGTIKSEFGTGVLVSGKGTGNRLAWRSGEGHLVGCTFKRGVVIFCDVASTWMAEASVDFSFCVEDSFWDDCEDTSVADAVTPEFGAADERNASLWRGVFGELGVASDVERFNPSRGLRPRNHFVTFSAFRKCGVG